MLKRKTLWSLMATALLVTACGGGGGGGNNNSSNGAAGGGSADNPPVSGNDNQVPNNPPTNNPSTNEPVTNNPGTDDPRTDPVVDQQLNRNLALVANQIAYIYWDRYVQSRPIEWGNDPYDAQTVETFEQGWGPNRVTMELADGGTPADMNTRVPPTVFAPAAPIAAIGFRVARQTIAGTTASQGLAQKAVGRVAFQFVERTDSAFIQAGQRAERMSFVIDNVELETSASGELIGARVLAGGRVHVYGTTATGNEIRATIPASAQSVRLAPIEDLHDSYGDTTSTVLLFDLEQAFQQAGNSVGDLKDLRGTFDVDITMSPLEKIVRPRSVNAESGALEWEARDLIGKAIQVGNMPPVTGAGVSIKLDVRVRQGLNAAQ